MERPAFRDVVRTGRAIMRGSPVEQPISLPAAIRELVTVDTPRDSPMTLRQAMRTEDYRDLSTAKVAVGDVAFDFELPRSDFTDGVGRPTGTTVRLSRYRDQRPVALIFGSYT
jgi:hypothetical protein